MANYTSPEWFSLKLHSYQAGNPLALSCIVDGSGDDYSKYLFEWRSTCKSDCFVRSEISHTVSTPYLHSRDLGTHTCVVHDFGRCSGNASIVVHVVGEFVEKPVQGLP